MEKTETGDPNSDFSDFFVNEESNEEEIMWLTPNAKGGATNVNLYLLAKQGIKDFLLFLNKGLFLRYESEIGIWQDDTEEFLSSMLTNRYLRKLTKINLTRETIKAIKDILKEESKGGKFRPCDPMKIVLKNGVYNIQTNEFSHKFDN